MVEFSGYCTYQDVEVKALIQFTLDKEAGTFDATYLSFNDVPQSTFMLNGLINTVFTSYLGEEGSASNEEMEEEALYPEEMQRSSDYIYPLDLAGYYTGIYGNSVAELQMYSESNDSVLGNISIYLDSEIEGYGGNTYEGELAELDNNIYYITGISDMVFLGMNYDPDNDVTFFELWINGNYVEMYYMSEYYTY